MPGTVASMRGMDTSYLSPKAAAQLLDIHPRTVLRWIAAGRLPAFRVGRLVRIARADLLAAASPITGGES
jgi:excisionase family DNA binding protein